MNENTNQKGSVIIAKHKLAFAAGAAAAGITTFVLLRQRKNHQQEIIRYQLADLLKQNFDNNEMYGYWIDFNPDENGDYPAGINVLDDDNETIDSYIFNFDAVNNKINDIELLNEQTLD